MEAIATHLHTGQLVILESTTYPGTVDEVVRPMLEEAGLRGGVDFFLAFSPERVDPGNAEWNTANIPKVVGGIDADSTAVVQVLYEQVVSTVVPVSSPRVAEMVKLLENTFRAVNIGLVNELALMSHRLGVDVWEVIEAANTKPFGFTPFCGVITTQHPQFDCQAIAARSACLVDTRNALKGLAGSHIHRL